MQRLQLRIWTLLPWDDRQWFAPRLSALPTFAMYLEGRGPALETVLRDRAEPAVEVTLLDAWNDGGIREIEPAYRSYAEAHLNSGDREGAIELSLRALEVDPGFANAARMLERIDQAAGKDEAPVPGHTPRGVTVVTPPSRPRSGGSRY